jgi:tripartite-type tricarboxylate transporter receptor subunit TctC
VARLLGQGLTERWGQPVVIDNRPGAGTTTGTRLVARAPADGHTALLTFTAHVQNPALYPQIGYDPLADFEAVSLVAKSSVILAVSADFPHRSLESLVQAVAAAPGRYAYGSYGVGTTGHILGELLKRQALLQMSHTPYKGGVPLGNDLAAGHIPIGLIAVGTAMPLLQSGRIVPVAITGARRSALLSQVPTFLELGYRGFEPDAWMGVLFPAGTPAEITAQLSQEISRLVRQPDIVQRLHGLNLEPVGSTPQAFAATLRADLAKWAQLVRELDIRPE